MSLDQILMIPGYSADGGSSATFSLTANNLVAGAPVLGTPTCTLNGASEFPAPSSYYLPTVTSSPYAVFDLRQRVSGYSGNCIKVRRASDDTTQDIGFDASGYLDESALETFCAGTDGFVDIWYAQGGTVAANLTQATTSNQPQIVSNGSVLKTSHNHPYMRFNSKSLTCTLTSTVSTGDVDWQVVFQHGNEPSNNAETPAFSGGKLLWLGTNTDDLSVTVLADGGFDIFFGNGSGSSVRMGDGDNTPAPFTGVWPAIWQQRCQYDDAALWRNRHPIATASEADPGASSVDELQVGDTGGGDFQIVSLVLMPRLSVADHTTLYLAENTYHGFGGADPADIDGTATVIQRDQFHIDLYAWLKARVPSDFTLTRSSLSSDGTYGDLDELLNLYLFLNEASCDVDYGLRVDDEWYVLDNGDGRGLETSEQGNVSFEDTSDGGMSNNIAAWYSQSVPLTGGGEGNPYYQQAALGRRALVLAMWDFLLYDTHCDSGENGNEQQIPFIGGNFDGITGAYRACKDLLDSTTQQAFVHACQWWIRLSLAEGPAGFNSNIDCKYVAGVCRIYEYLDDRHKALAVQSVKRLFFGAVDGTTATTNGNGNYGDQYGIVGLAGSVVEGGGYESNYNGRALRHIAEGRSWVASNTEWGFLDDVIEGICDHINYQTFPDQGDFDGPTDYASRTGGSIWRNDQDTLDMRHWAAAAFSTSAYPLLRYKAPIQDTATMVSGIQSGAAAKNTDFSDATSITGTSAAHTNGIDYSITFLGDSGTNELVITGTNQFSVDDRLAVYAGSGGTLPGGLDNDTRYWVTAVSGQRVTLSMTQGGATVPLSSDGSGTLYFAAIVYLTDTPDLSQFSTTNQRWYITIGSKTGVVRFVDDSADYVVARATFNIASGSPQNYIYGQGPLPWGSNRTWWPSTYPFFPPAGTYSTLKTLSDASDSSLDLPYERSAAFNINRGNADHFWHYKTTGKTPDYGWMIHCPEDPGDYKGFYSGTLGAFWTSDYGIAICGKHDKSGSDPPDENTRVWAEIEQWATQHWWGRDTSSTPLRWSTAALDSSGSFTPSATTTFDETGTPKKVTHVVSFGMGNGAPRGGETANVVTGTAAAHTNGVATRTITLTNAPDLSGLNLTQNDYYLVLDGQANFTGLLIASVDDGADTVTLDASEATQNIASGSAVNYEILASAVDGACTITKVWEERSGGDGIKVTETLTSDQVDYMTEMWATIPCLLQRDDESGTDANIEYWNGSTWLPIPTSLTSGVEWIRCRRSVSGTDEFVWINFSGASQSIKRPTTPYVQDYQGNARILPVFIDMLGYTGSAVQLASTKTLVWEATTTDPNLTATAPVASIQQPAAGARHPEGRRFAVQAEVTWQGSTSHQVDLEYSTNSGSTWNTVGTMTLTSGTEGAGNTCTYEYLGGSIPASMTHIRINASDNLGSTADGTEIVAATNTYTQVLNDPFAGISGDLIDSTYSGWTTNTTGNSYVDHNPCEIQSNKASCTAVDLARVETSAIAALSSTPNDFIVEADIVCNTASDQTPLKACGICARVRANSLVNMTATGVRLILDSTGYAGQAQLLEPGGSMSDQAIAIPGFANGTAYRLCLDCRSNIVVAQVRDASTDAVIGETVAFDASYGLTEAGRWNVGVQVYQETGNPSDTADDLKVWIPS